MDLYIIIWNQLLYNKHSRPSVVSRNYTRSISISYTKSMPRMTSYSESMPQGTVRFAWKEILRQCSYVQRFYSLWRKAFHPSTERQRTIDWWEIVFCCELRNLTPFEVSCAVCFDSEQTQTKSELYIVNINVFYLNGIAVMLQYYFRYAIQ